MELPLIIIFISASFILLIVYIISFWTSYVPVGQATFPTQNKQVETTFPSFSIVIVTHDCDSLLERLVTRLVAQDYPNFEIVIVNNASTDNTDDIIKRLSVEHPNKVRYTYLPQNKNGNLHMSMATTLGARAARNEWIVLLKPTSFPKSDHWLTSISTAISQGAEICIGYNDYFGYDNSKWERNAIAKRRKAQLLNYRAIFRGKRKPIDCEGSNVIFSKSEFFKNGGYGSWLVLIDCHEIPYVTTYSKKGKTIFLTEPTSQVETILPPIKELWKTERSHALKSYKKLGFMTKLRRNYYAIITCSYLFSVACLLMGIYFVFNPLPIDKSTLRIKELSYLTNLSTIQMAVISSLFFLIISLLHFLCVLYFRHRDHKRLYVPLCTNPSEIMTM